MSTDADLNPYTPTAASDELVRTKQSLIFRILLVLAALNLLLHSGLMIFGYSLQFSVSQSITGYFATYFFPAMFVKDGLSLITAMFGAVFIFYRHALGWWMAVANWTWYLAWNAVIVFTAESFAWQFPVRFSQAEVFTGTLKCLIYSAIALVFFNLTPTIRLLNAPEDRRLLRVTLIFVLAVALGFLVNWWSSLD